MKEFCSLKSEKKKFYKSTFQHSAVLETGLPDSHLLTVTKLKMSFQKCKNYKNYYNDVFRSEIQSFYVLNETDLVLFKESIFCIINKHAPIIKKVFAQTRLLS